MARTYPVWARSLVDPVSFENEQIRLGQIWTLLGVATDVANDGDWFRTVLGGPYSCSDLVRTYADLKTFVHTVFTRFGPKIRAMARSGVGFIIGNTTKTGWQ